MQIYYFTRTGRCEKIANEIAKANGATANKITDEKDWSGAGNFLRGGFMSSTKKQVPIKFSPVNENEDLVLVFPIWAGSFPPAVRSFLDEVKRDNITLIATSLGTKLKDRDGFAKIYDLIGKEISTPSELLK